MLAQIHFQSKNPNLINPTMKGPLELTSTRRFFLPFQVMGVSNNLNVLKSRPSVIGLKKMVNVDNHFSCFSSHGRAMPWPVASFGPYIDTLHIIYEDNTIP